MKKLAHHILPGLLALALLPLTSYLTPLRAQGGYSAYAAQILIDGGTNNVAFAATNTYNLGLTLTRQREVAVQVSFRSLGTNDSTILLRFQPSVDGVSYDTNNAQHNLSVLANGTNTVVMVTNLVAPASIGFLRLASIGNPNSAQAITNVTVQYAIKR